MKYKTQEKGQAIVLIVLAIVGLVAITALAVDGGNVFADRRKAQSAADNAALAAARQKVMQSSYNFAQIQAAADNIITANTLPNMVERVVNYPPANGCDGNPSPLAGDSNFLQVVIKSTVDTYFGPVIGVDTLSHCVEAVAKARSSQMGNPFEGSAIVALECSTDKAFRAQGNGTLKVMGGGITVNSDEPVDASVTLGNIKLWTGYFNTAGGIKGVENILNSKGTGPADISQSMVQYAPCPQPVTLPIPEPNCNLYGNSTKDPITNRWSPGKFKGADLNNAILDPGVYCISGNKDAKLMSGDTLWGEGVMLYFTNIGLDLTSAGEVHLIGYNNPSSPWNNILVYASHTNTNTFKWNGNSDSYFQGSILIPMGAFELLGTGDVDTGMHSQIIARTLLFTGDSVSMINYNPDENLNFMIAPAVELVH